MLTDMELNILLYASRYLYLTNRQILSLGLGSSLRVIARKTRHLSHAPNEKAPFLGVIKYPPSARTGRVEHVYFLTLRGSQILTSLYPEQAFPFVSNPAGYFRDYHHRFSCVQVHIALTLWLQKYPELTLSFWDRYFEKTGANRSRFPERLHALTRVELDHGFIIPDILFLVRKWASREGGLLVALEVSNGMDTNRVLQQLTRHMEGLRLAAVGRKYNLQTGHKVVVVFIRKSLFDAVRKRFSEIPSVQNFYDFFLFATLEDLVTDPEFCFWKASPNDGPYHLLSGKRILLKSSICHTF